MREELRHSTEPTPASSNRLVVPGRELRGEQCRPVQPHLGSESTPAANLVSNVRRWSRCPRRFVIRHGFCNLALLEGAI